MFFWVLPHPEELYSWMCSPAHVVDYVGWACAEAAKACTQYTHLLWMTRSLRHLNWSQSSSWILDLDSEIEKGRERERFPIFPPTNSRIARVLTWEISRPGVLNPTLLAKSQCFQIAVVTGCHKSAIIQWLVQHSFWIYALGQIQHREGRDLAKRRPKPTYLFPVRWKGSLFSSDYIHCKGQRFSLKRSAGDGTGAKAWTDPPLPAPFY